MAVFPWAAMMLALRYSEIYSRVALLFPAAEPEDLFSENPKLPGNAMTPLVVWIALRMILCGICGVLRREPYPKDAELRPLWMCCGLEDVLVEKACERFSLFLNEKRISHPFVCGQGENDLIYWDEHLEEAFLFLAER